MPRRLRQLSIQITWICAGSLAGRMTAIARFAKHFLAMSGRLSERLMFKTRVCRLIRRFIAMHPSADNLGVLGKLKLQEAEQKKLDKEQTGRLLSLSSIIMTSSN
jgi:hypothetical protein